MNRTSTTKTRDTTADQVEKFIKQCRPSVEIKVEKIVTRGDYASFKICAPEVDFDAVMAPEFWPAGVAIKEWRTRALVRHLNYG